MGAAGMIWQLRDQRLPESDRQRLDFLLRQARWIWPVDGDTGRMTWIAKMFDGLSAPPMRTGQVPIVSFSDGNATVWMLGGDELPSSLPAPFRTAGYEWAADARRAWDDALLAAVRSLPILFTALSQARSIPLRVVPINSVSRDGTLSVPAAVLTGRSFGLAFLLACVSRVFKISIPDDVAASAEVDNEGRVTGVGGLSAKMHALRETLPRVTRLLIAVDQVHEVQHLSDRQLRIVGIRDARAAIEEVFGDRLTTPIVAAGTDPARRTELVEALFRLALGKRAQLVSWAAVRDAALMAEKAWSDSLDADQLYELQLVRATASRHEDNEGAIQAPTNSWLQKWSMPIRVAILARLVQQCADTGTPSAESVESLAAPYIADPRDAYPAQLKLAGALARLAAVRGRSREALDTQRRLARSLVANLEFDEISYQMAEWYRLAGALGDEDAFREAECFLRQVQAIGGFGLDGNPYVELARCRAMVLLPRLGNPTTALSELTQTPIDHLRWSAIRWLVRHTRSHDLEHLRALRQATTAPMSSPRGPSRRRLAMKFAALVDIDRAVANGEVAEGERLVEELAVLEPGVMGHLLSVAPGNGRAHYVAQFYPY
jgi:hypothetical protein